MRQFLKTVPAVQYLYGQYRLQRLRQAYGPEFSRLADLVACGVPPLCLANSLNEFESLVRHPLFPPELIDSLMPPGPGSALDRAFVNFTAGHLAEQAVAAEWQRAQTISEDSERRLTEYLNRYITYALRTFAVYLEVLGHPKSSDAIRISRVLGELEGEDGELLDVGCAFVPLAERYARMRRWVGLDLSLPSLGIGRIVHHVPAASLVCGYSESLPFPDGSFDVVVSSEVLEHTPRPLRMIAEIARVLRGGGKAVVSVPMHIVDFQGGRQHRIGPTDSTHRLQFHSLDDLQRLFPQHGLPVERLQSDPHYIFTLRRDKSGVQAFRRSGVRVDRDGLASDLAGPECLNARTPERLNLACPDCRAPLEPSETALHCPTCDVRFARRGGVPVLLPRDLRPARLDLAA
jgi:SAM-dependent methyltransferase